MLKMRPCPSPRGTNFERLFIVKAPARSPRGQLALDEAPTFKKRGSSAGEEGEGRGVTHPTASFRVRQSPAIEVSPRRPSSTMRIFSSAAWCFRVARRMLRTSVSGRRRGGVGFLSHLRSVRATMRQISSDPRAVRFVSQALKRDILER